MDLAPLVPVVLGTTIGVVGTLVVGLYIQRQQFARTAKNAGRAVYFELDMNRLKADVAAEYGAFTPLSRSSFERLLPELATWLEPEELHTVVAAYMSHAGYEQAGSDRDLPPEVRRNALLGVLAAQDRAISLLSRRVFSEAEARKLADAEATSSSAPTLAADEPPLNLDAQRRP
jgi:hypothetical protein